MSKYRKSTCPKTPWHVSPSLQLLIKRQLSADGSLQNLGGAQKFEGICQNLEYEHAQRPLGINSSVVANQDSAVPTEVWKIWGVARKNEGIHQNLKKAHA